VKGGLVLCLIVDFFEKLVVSCFIILTLNSDKKVSATDYRLYVVLEMKN